jgi:hypothetical protein
VVQPPPYGYQPDPYYAQFGPRQPGCVPLRPLTLGDILQGSFAVIRRNPRLVLGMSAAAAVLQAVALAIFQILFLRDAASGFDNSDPDHPRVHLGRLVHTESLSLVQGALGAIVTALLTIVLTIVVTEDVLGHRMTLAAVWERVRTRLLRLTWVALISSAVPILGIFLCIAPGVWLWGIWAVAVPAMVVENGSVRHSLRRSVWLVRGMFWRVFGIRALGVLVAAAASLLISLPFLIVAAVTTNFNQFRFDTAGTVTTPIAFILITAVGTAVSSTLTAPITASVDALLYVDLRMRKEQLDVALRQQAAANAYAAQAAQIAQPPGPLPPASPGGPH